MGFLDLTAELLRKIDFEKSEIILPQKLVFVCGGKKSPNMTAPTSMREILLARAEATGKQGEFAEAKVLLAEVAVNALADSSFKNLLDLERFIAAVVYAVILIVESPGSICELGAFVMVPEISEKLIVIMQGEFKNLPSFITNGAIDYLKEHTPSAQIYGYDWTTKNGVISAPNYVLDAMLDEIPTAMQSVHKSYARETFRRDKIGHLIYLTLAFCHLLRAAKKVDLKRCFDNANIRIEDSILVNCIDTLLLCNLMKRIPKGRLDYYVAIVDRIPLEIAFQTGIPDADRNTIRWIRRISDAIKMEEEFRLEIFRGHHYAR